MSVHQDDAPTETFPRQRFAGDVVFEETARPVDPAAVPVVVVPGPVWPAPPRFEVNGSSVNPGYGSPEVRASAEETVRGIFAEHGPEAAWGPVSGDGLVEAAAVESGPRHAAVELSPAEEVPMSPLVERLLNDAARCGGCLAAWPCGKDGHPHGPFVPGEDVGASGEPDPLWFGEVSAGRPFGWRQGHLGQALAAVEQGVLAAVERCEADTRRAGAARRAERFAALREELAGVFAAAAVVGGLVDEPAAAGGPVDSPVDAEHPPAELDGGCEFVVRGQAEVAGPTEVRRGPDGELLFVVDGVEHGADGDVVCVDPDLRKPYTARCWCGLDFTAASHDGAEEDRQVHLDGMRELAEAAGGGEVDGGEG